MHCIAYGYGIAARTQVHRYTSVTYVRKMTSLNPARLMNI